MNKRYRHKTRKDEMLEIIATGEYSHFVKRLDEQREYVIRFSEFETFYEPVPNMKYVNLYLERGVIISSTDWYDSYSEAQSKITRPTFVATAKFEVEENE